LENNRRIKKNLIYKTIIMKTYINNSLLLILSLFLLSCSDDDTPEVKKPSISYDSNTINAVFFESGNITPTLNWNGNTGTIEVFSEGLFEDDNLNINENTGEITWTYALEEGVHYFDIVATNSAGTTTIEMSIDNTLQGVFFGTYESPGSNYLRVEFNKDGTASVQSDEITTPMASGIWTMNNDAEIILNYTYPSGSEYSLKGFLYHSGSGASYSGNWYNGHGALNTNLGNTFDVQIPD